MASKRFKGTNGIIQIPLVLEDAARLEKEYKAAQSVVTEIEKEMEVTMLSVDNIHAQLRVVSLLDQGASEAARVAVDLFPLEVKYGRQGKKLSKAQKALGRKKLEIKEFLTDSIGFEFSPVGDRIIYTVANRLDELQKLIR